MGKRKGRKETQETLISTHENGEIHDEAEEGKGDKFFACYLLTSVCPRFKGHTYIGFTVNPRRRIRQHNGEIGSGAWRTKRKRPWEMVLCIYGFPTNVAALQFEWAWQHPGKSLAVRTAAASFKSVSGLANKIKMAYTMLSLPQWQNLHLTMNFFSTKYQKHTLGCPPLPQQMQIQICSMDDLPCYNGNYACINDEQDFDGECDAVVNSVHASPAQESTEVIETVAGSSRIHGSSEERSVHIHVNDKDDSSCEFSEANVVMNEEAIPIMNSNHASPTQESTEVIETVPDSSRMHGSYEENVHVHINYKDDISCENGVMNEEAIPTMNSWIHSEVEIIDLFTPSPSYRVNLGSKKRRPNMYPEVIDLTNSPLFV